MIELTMAEVVDSVSILQKLVNKPLKTIVAFQVARIIREIEKEFNLFQKSRKDLVEKYGERNEKGELITTEDGNYTISQDKVNDFNEEMLSIMNEVVTLNANKIHLEDLEGETFTPGEIHPLMAFIEE